MPPRAICSRRTSPTSNLTLGASASPALIASSVSSILPPPARCTDLPPELREPLAAISDQTLPVASFSYGTQVCEVEVDPETGAVDIVGYTAVDDVKRAVNPMILHGQTQGGIAQGTGQALLEDCHYDPRTGQLLAASFMDYAMSRADTPPARRSRTGYDGDEADRNNSTVLSKLAMFTGFAI